MPQFGFIRDKLDVKVLVLYLAARVAAPIDFATLTDLCMCDEGVDYFMVCSGGLRACGIRTSANRGGFLYHYRQRAQKRLCLGGKPALFRAPKVQP